MDFKRNLLVAVMFAGASLSGTALADAVIYNTGDAATATVALGVFDEGHLNVADPTGHLTTTNAGAVGLAFRFPDGSWRDATAPGCLCEGWGFSATSGGTDYTAGASVDNFAPGNLTFGPGATDAAAGTGSFFTSSASMTSLPGLSITQHYTAADNAPGVLFQNTVTITNTTGDTISDLRYTRVMDWDVPPTEFDEYVTIKGTGTTSFLERSHDDGFETVDPLLGLTTTPIDPTTLNVDFEDNGPNDHGAYFLFNFGDLADGESYEFTIFYGAAASERTALAAIAAEGIELFSLGQSSGIGGPDDGVPATFIFGFAGVGGVPVIPVSLPGTLLLTGFGLLALGIAARRRRLS